MLSDTTANAVCIGFDTDDPPTELREALASFRCVHYRDVYRALARVGRDQPAVIIVDVGWLPSVAFEIFDVLAHSHVGLPVLVTGPGRADARIRDALARGAMGLATADAVAACAPAGAPREPAPRIIGGPGRQPPREAAPEPSDTFASAGNVFDAALDQRLNEQLDSESNAAEVSTVSTESPEAPQACEPTREAVVADAAEALEPADAPVTEEASDSGGADPEPADEGTRVPWLRYTDRPRRTPPQRSPPAARSVPEPPVRPAPPAPPPARSAFDAPLLSEAELAALLSPLQRGRQK